MAVPTRTSASKLSTRKWLHLSLTLSTAVFCLHTMFAFPISPPVENFTPSFVTDMITARHESLEISDPVHAKRKAIGMAASTDKNTNSYGHSNRRDDNNFKLPAVSSTNLCRQWNSDPCKCERILKMACAQWLGTQSQGFRDAHCQCPSASSQSQIFSLDLPCSRTHQSVWKWKVFRN